jgi:deoxyribodipyrimidine photo-lyase
MEFTATLNRFSTNPSGSCVLYWMQSSQRADGNPALNEAIHHANESSLPLVVFFGLDSNYPGANARSLSFMVDGLRETSAELERAGIPFVARLVNPPDGIAELARTLNASEVIVDNGVLKHQREWRAKAARLLNVRLTEVTSQTVLPVDAYGKQAVGAYALRPFFRKNLEKVIWDQSRPKILYPTPMPGIERISLSDKDTSSLLDTMKADRSVPPVRRFTPGRAEGLKRLAKFVSAGLAGYNENRNKANLRGCSELSPYLHFGQLGPHDVAEAVMDSDAPQADRDAFLEQLLVRRELAWNLCRFNPDYDSIKGIPRWAQATLSEHADDPRPYLYTREELEAGETHDEVWNTAQREMVATGYMHNYVRMLWAKKILEWSPTPEIAYETALWLNDKYELDGRDPNGYTGVAWAIGGTHDRPWFKRPVFGAIRYMSSDSTRKKMDIPAYRRLVDHLADIELF